MKKSGATSVNSRRSVLPDTKGMAEEREGDDDLSDAELQAIAGGLPDLGWLAMRNDEGYPPAPKDRKPGFGPSPE
jgi:hypothetical protein